MKKIILFAFTALVSITALAQVQGYAVGEVVDDFTVTDTEGNVHNLYDITSQGKYVYIDMFFVNCPPCQQTVQYWNEFHEKYGCNEGNVFMISINDTGDNDAQVIAFEEQYGGDFQHSPAVSTVEGGGDVPGDAINVVAYPTYFLIGPDNTLLINDIWPISSVADFEASIPSGSGIEPMQCSALAIEDTSTVSFSVFPNPSTSGLINIKLSNNVSGSSNVTIYNVLGSLVYTNTFSQNEFAIATNLSSGSYIISIATEAGVSNKSLIVK